MLLNTSVSLKMLVVDSFKWALPTPLRNLSLTSYMDYQICSTEWIIFCEMTLYQLSKSAGTSTTATSFTFEDAAKLLTEKANSIVGRCKLSGPGSEYASAAVTEGGSAGKVNSTTGI